MNYSQLIDPKTALRIEIGIVILFIIHEYVYNSSAKVSLGVYVAIFLAYFLYRIYKIRKGLTKLIEGLDKFNSAIQSMNKKNTNNE